MTLNHFLVRRISRHLINATVLQLRGDFKLARAAQARARRQQRALRLLREWRVL